MTVAPKTHFPNYPTPITDNHNPINITAFFN